MIYDQQRSSLGSVHGLMAQQQVAPNVPKDHARILRVGRRFVAALTAAAILFTGGPARAASSASDRASVFAEGVEGENSAPAAVSEDAGTSEGMEPVPGTGMVSGGTSPKVSESLESVPGTEMNAGGTSPKVSESLESVLGAEALYGGAVTYGAVTAAAVREETDGNARTVTIHIAPSGAEPVNTYDYFWGLYSPSAGSWARDGSSAAIAHDAEHWWEEALLGSEGCDLTLRFVGEALSDYQLTCLKVTYPRPSLGGIGCYAYGAGGIVGKSEIDGFEVSGTQQAEDIGSHVFALKSDAASSEDLVTVRTDASGASLRKTYSFALTLPQDLPRGIGISFVHAFWAKDGRIQVAGAAEGENYLAAAYDAAGTMLESVLLEAASDGQDGQAYLSGQMKRRNGISQVRIFALDDAGAPLAEALERPELIQVSEASVGQSWGNQKARGYATVSIEGTGSAGDVTLQTGAGYQMPPDARRIAVVDARIDGGEGELEGVAEIRVKYKGDVGNNRDLSPDQLLPGCYDEETGKWETVPFLVDEESHEVVILAEHFSTWGVFEIVGDGTRNAFIEGIDENRFTHMQAELYRTLLEPYEDATAAAQVDFETTGQTLESLDGSFNSNWWFAPGVIDTAIQNHGSAELKANPWAKGLNRSCTVIGLVGAGISLAGSVYRNGVNHQDTYQATFNLAKTIGMNFASASLQWAVVAIDATQLAYSLYAEREQKQVNAQVEKAYQKWRARQADWPATLRDWKKQELDPRYEKYVTKGSADKTLSARYQEFMSAAKARIRYYPYRFYEDWMSGDLKKKYPEIDMPEYDTSGTAMDSVDGVCYNAETELLRQLAPYFKEHARKHYVAAVKDFRKLCLQEQERLNQTIRLHLEEEIPEGGQSIAQGYVPVLLGTDVYGIGEDWGGGGFDEKGQADMTFTGTALAMGRGEIHLVSKQTGRWAKTIVLREESVDYSGVNTVTFTTEDLPQTIHVHERKGDGKRKYVYPGYQLRLKSQADGYNDRTWTLSEIGSAFITITPKEYYEGYCPEEGVKPDLEVVDPETDEVVNVVPLDLFQTDVILEPQYVVLVSCADENAKKHYAGALVELGAVGDDGTREIAVKARIDGRGKASLRIDQSKRKFYESEKNRESFFLNVTPYGEKMPDRGLQPAFDERNVWKAVLDYSINTDNRDPLVLDKRNYTIFLSEVGESSVPLEVSNGSIASITYKDPKDKEVAVGTRNRIIGYKPGGATILYEDASDPENVIEVHVSVIKAGLDSFGIYRGVKIYEEKNTISGYELDDCPNPGTPIYCASYLSANFQGEEPVTRIYGLQEYQATGIRYTPGADSDNPMAGLKYDIYENKFMPLNEPDELMRLYFYQDGAWTMEPERWSRSYWTESASDGTSYTKVEIMSEPDAGIFYVERRYQYTLTEFKGLEEAVYNAIQNGEIEAGTPQVYSAGAETEGFAGMEAAEAEQITGAEAAETGCLAGREAEETRRFTGTEAVETGRISGAEAVGIWEAPGEDAPGPLGAEEESVLTPDADGDYSIAWEGSAGKRYSIFALRGELQSLPQGGIRDWQDRLCYLDVRTVEEASVVSRFRVQEAGDMTLFVATEGSAPVVRGHIRGNGSPAEVAYIVSFRPEGGTGEMAEARVAAEDAFSGADYTLPACGFDPPEGMAFDRWSLGAAGETVRLYEDMVLKARWKKLPATTWTLSFHANGGSGTMEDQVFAAGEKGKLSANRFRRPGYQFLGWTPTWYNGYATYADGAEVTDLAAPGAKLVLYAVWLEEGKTPPPIQPTDPDPNPDPVPVDPPGETIYEEVPAEVLQDKTKVSRLKFQKSSLKLQRGAELSHPAVAAAAAGVEAPAVTYVTSNRDIAYVTKDGMFHARDIGTATITAYCGTKRATCKVTVTAGTERIHLLDDSGTDRTKEVLEMKAGEQEVLSVSFEPVDTTDPRAVTWRSGNKKVATVAGGVVTAREVREAGTAEITATVKYTDPADGKVKQLVESVTVQVAPLEIPAARSKDKTHSLSLSKGSIKLVTGSSSNAAKLREEAELTVKVAPKGKGATFADLTILDCASSNEDIFTVTDSEPLGPADRKGVKGQAQVKLRARAPGTAYLIVRTGKAGAEEGADNLRRCKVVVTSPGQSLSLGGGTLKLSEGAEEIAMRQGSYGTLEATLSPSGSTDLSKVKWSASGGVTVKNGLVYAKSVTKNKPAKVTVKCGKLSATVLIQVTR